MEKQVFHIGELSDMFEISVDSLRYYEKKGLLHPHRNEANGYREYSMADFQTIVLIRELLGLDFNTDQIEEFLRNRRVNRTLHLLNEEISAISEQIMRLQAKQNNLQNRLISLQETLLADTDEKVRLLHLPARSGIMISNENLPDSYVDYSLVKYMKKRQQEINAIGYADCYSLDLEGSNPNSDYYRTANVFFLIKDPQMQGDFTLPEGDYLSLYYRGSLKKTKQLMPRLLDYAKKNQLSVSGLPMELCHIDSYETAEEEEYVIELQLPVRSALTPPSAH